MTPEALIEAIEHRLQEAFRAVQPLPGVVQLVHHLVAHKIPIAVRSPLLLSTAPAE